MGEWRNIPDPRLPPCNRMHATNSRAIEILGAAACSRYQIRGILLSRKKPAIVAAAAHRIISDSQLASAFKTAGTQQLQRFSMDIARERLFKALETL